MGYNYGREQCSISKLPCNIWNVIAEEAPKNQQGANRDIFTEINESIKMEECCDNSQKNHTSEFM